MSIAERTLELKETVRIYNRDQVLFRPESREVPMDEDTIRIYHRNHNQGK